MTMVEAAAFRARKASTAAALAAGGAAATTVAARRGGGKALVGHLKVHAILSQRPFTQYCMNLKMAGHFAHGAAAAAP